MFKKSNAVAVLTSWDNNGTVTIRRGTVHSCGKKVMRMIDPITNEMFGAAMSPENRDKVSSFNHVEVIADADNATLETAALNLGEAIRQAVVAKRDHCIAWNKEQGREIYNIAGLERQITELHEPRVRWHHG